MASDRVRVATQEDFGAFMGMFEEYLKERESNGSMVVVSDAFLTEIADLYLRIALGRIEGVALIVPSKAVALWGPALPYPTKFGRTMPGHGTYVRPQFRRSGLAKRIYEVGFAILRELGVDAFLGSVDEGNAAGQGHATHQNAEIVQTVQVVRL